MVCPFKKKVITREYSDGTVTKEEFCPCDREDCPAWGITKIVSVPPGQQAYAGETTRANYGCMRIIDRPLYITE